MADELNIFTRTSKVFYEKISNTLRDGRQGIEQLLFGTPNESTSATFAIDSFITNPYGVAFRRAGEQSAVRANATGTGVIIEVPRTSEKTPITEFMRDSVTVGQEELTAQATQEAELFNQIMRQHTSAHQATKAKLSIDVMRTGIFSPLGTGGADIGLSYDFGRDSSLDITYDFTAVGATIDEALGNLYDAYRAQGGSPGNMVINMGSSWLASFEGDSAVLSKAQNNIDNILVTTELVPPELLNTQGLYLIGRYRIPGRATPVWLTTYSPEDQYIAYNGASAADFFPATEAIIFSLGATRYRVLRGVDVIGTRGESIRTKGDLVFDTYTTDDPVITWMRSSTRYIFAPANVDHTGRSVGTFV